MQSIKTNHGEIRLPAFMPDATYGSIRNTSFADTKKAGIKELVTTTLHLEQKLGSEYIKKYGGLHKFFGWDRPILTDSGGWQVFSLINSNRANPKNKITEVGCSFVDPDNGKYSLLSPESSMSIQHNLGADIVTVLDDPILPNASYAERKESVRINTAWAKRSKEKFLELNGVDRLGGFSFADSVNLDRDTNALDDSALENNQGTDSHNYKSKHSIPLIGCVIQGADDFDLRKQSAEELLELDFDLYNFGGVPMLSEITWKEEYPEGFHREMLAYVSSLIPDNKIKYAMGVGQPEDIAFCVEHGWHLFDTVLPTRNARHGYLYVSEGQGDDSREYRSHKDSVAPLGTEKMSYDVMHLRSKRYEFDEGPVDEHCDCETCQSVSRAYLRHLLRIKEPAGFRLATIHNLRFYARWMERIQDLRFKI